jgi:hypothetical protein
MSRYFSLFPIIPYDIAGKRLTSYQNTTNIFFRLRIIRDVLTNFTSYYEYIISESDTPEILADKVYGDPEAHWVILLANNILDPQYDWPLNSRDFKNYIIKKYGSIENAQTTYHHYEKVVRREEPRSGNIVEDHYVINQANLTSNLSSTFADVPYDTYTSLADEQDVSTINYGFNNGKTVFEIIYRNRVTNYDYELQLNEDKRTIKIIKPEYYNQIIREFDDMTGKSRVPYLRRLV